MTNKFSEEIKALKGPSKEAEQEGYVEAVVQSSIILPFFTALGYNIHNPKEVKPQFTPENSLNKGKKVDYALIINNAPIMLIEAKTASIIPLQSSHIDQLYHYFTPSDVKLGILTNGIEAWFYSDFNKINVMDDEPFFKFDFQKNNDSDLRFLKLLCKNEFSSEKIKEHAKKMKIVDEVKNFIETDVINPSKKFTDFVMKNVLGGNFKKNNDNKKIVESAVADSMQAIKVKNLMQANESTVEPVDNSPISTATSQSETKDSRNKWHKKPRPEVKKLYEKYSKGIKEIADGISENCTAGYFGYRKNGRILFCSLGLQKESMRIGLKFNNIIEVVLGDHAHGCDSTPTGTNHLGTGIHYVKISLDHNGNDNSNYDYIIEQIRRTYEQA